MTRSHPVPLLLLLSRVTRRLAPASTAERIRGHSTHTLHTAHAHIHAQPRIRLRELRLLLLHERGGRRRSPELRLWRAKRRNAWLGRTLHGSQSERVRARVSHLGLAERRRLEHLRALHLSKRLWLEHR